MKKAYCTTWNGITSIVAAESVSQARSRTQASANEAGYGPEWCDIRVVRAPEWDEWAAVDERNVKYDRTPEVSHDDA